MFTPKKASEILEIPLSTLRRYRSQWADYLSAPDEKRRYTQDDLDTLRTIRDLMGERKSHDEIAAALREPPEPPLTGEIFEDEIPQEDEPRSAIQSIDFFAQVIDQLTDEHKTALMAKDETIGILTNDRDRLQREIAYLRLPWWKRIFREPPE